jgi:hypothetical protein
MLLDLHTQHCDSAQLLPGYLSSATMQHLNRTSHVGVASVKISLPEHPCLSVRVSRSGSQRKLLLPGADGHRAGGPGATLRSHLHPHPLRCLVIMLLILLVPGMGAGSLIRCLVGLPSPPVAPVITGPGSLVTLSVPLSPRVGGRRAAVLQIRHVWRRVITCSPVQIFAI